MIGMVEKKRVLIKWAELRDSDLFEDFDVWVELIPNGSSIPKDLKMALSILEKYEVIDDWWASTFWAGAGFKKRITFRISIDSMRFERFMKRLLKGDQ